MSNDPVPYSEDNEDHVPNPHYQTGVVDTTGTFGDTGARIENISPVFAQGKADAFANAVDAIDDPDRNADEVVVFQEGENNQLSRDEAEEQLRAAAEDAANNPQLTDPNATPAAAEAAEEGEDDDAAGSAGGGTAADAGDDDGLPNDSDSKAKWAQYADDNKLDVDQSLNKADYVAAVKKAAKK